ncbi:MAG: hypothetical protein EP330_13850 [Deltaproteobacteria bacterium]|nr:MAG: hypothetical protein EP330_13850 [Deltaproteobacteria bacterium]
MSSELRVRLSVLVILATGCNGADPTYGLPEDRGMLLTEDAGPSIEELWPPDNGSLAWSADGGEVFYQSRYTQCGACVDLIAVNVETGESRTVVSDLWPPYQLAASADGAWLYFASRPDQTVYPDQDVGVFRVPVEGGTPEHVYEAEFHRYALSHDGSLLAVGGAVFDIAQATPTSVTMGEPVQFSPDDSEVLHLGEGEAGITSVSTGLSETWTEAPLGLYTVGVLWLAGRRELLYVEGSMFSDDRVERQLMALDEAGNTRAITEAGELGVEFEATASSVSPDGTQVAIWFNTYDTEQPPNDEGCGYGQRCQQELLLFDTATGDPSRIGATVVEHLGVPQNSRPWNMVFSPDGSRLAYFLGPRSIYVQDVP